MNVIRIIRLPSVLQFYYKSNYLFLPNTNTTIIFVKNVTKHKTAHFKSSLFKFQSTVKTWMAEVCYLMLTAVGHIFFFWEMLQLELSRACPVLLSCLSLLTKRPFIIQMTFRMCLFVTSTVATQFTAHPTVQVTFIQTKCMTLLTVDSFPHSWYLYFVVSDYIEFNISFICDWYRPKADTIWNIKFFLLGEIRKIFQSTRGPTKGLIFHSGTSVPPLKFLYVCPVFRSNLV